MPALRPAHSFKLPHAVFAWSLAALITSLARSLRSVFLNSTERTPGCLSSATRQHAISAQCATQGGGEVAIQLASLATMTLNSYDEHPKQRSQFISPIFSAPSAPAAPERFDATHVTSSSVKSRGTVSGTSPYFSKAAHVGFYTGGTHMSGCFSRRTSATGRLALVH